MPVKPRPPITLLRHYRNPWKAAYHHFQRYSDIRVKGECLTGCKQKYLIFHTSSSFFSNFKGGLLFNFTVDSYMCGKY